MKIEITTTRFNSEVHEQFIKLLATTFGGVTIFKCEGIWYNSKGRKFVDQNVRYEVITNLGKLKNVSKLIDNVIQLAIDLNEECILLRVGNFSRFVFASGVLQKV